MKMAKNQMSLTIMKMKISQKKKHGEEQEETGEISTTSKIF
jgi:hypothetical protein